MGTIERRAREKDAKRRGILRAAIRLFARKGYDATALDDVARSAEVAKGTVYLYFPSKADLFATLLLEVGFDKFSSTLERALSECRDARSALRAFAACYQEMCLRGEKEIFDLFVQLDRGDIHRDLSEELRAEALRRHEVILGQIAEWVDRGREAGELSCPEGRRVARVLWALCIGVSHLARQEAGSSVLEDAMNCLLEGLVLRRRR